MPTFAAAVEANEEPEIRDGVALGVGKAPEDIGNCWTIGLDGRELDKPGSCLDWL